MSRILMWSELVPTNKRRQPTADTRSGLPTYQRKIRTPYFAPQITFTTSEKSRLSDVIGLSPRRYGFVIVDTE